MQIGLYKGKSGISLAIRWITRSPYSHAAFVFDIASAARADAMLAVGAYFRRLRHYNQGAVIEAWKGGVKNSPSVSTLHTKGTPVDIFKFSIPLNNLEEDSLISRLDGEIGLPYDYRDVLRFITRIPGKPGHHRFCSLLVSRLCKEIRRELFKRTEDWEVPPGWIQRSLSLDFHHSAITN